MKDKMPLITHKPSLNSIITILMAFALFRYIGNHIPQVTNIHIFKQYI